MTTQINGNVLSIGGVTLADSSALTIPVGQRKNYTPTVTPGSGLASVMAVSGYSLDLGTVKMVWAKHAYVFNSGASTSGQCTITLPNGLFTAAPHSVHFVSHPVVL